MELNMPDRKRSLLPSVGVACAKSCRQHILAAACMAILATTGAVADPLVDAETRVDQAKAKYGLTGRNVLVAIMDRGLDYTHPDFINADGTTRVEAIFDLTDDAGATAPGNTYGMGTLYTKTQIQAALAGPKLATRDAVGHGTSTAGLCCGNGRASNGKYKGPAENSRLLIIKITSDGAPAHDGQPAEAPFYDGSRILVAIDWATAKAHELGLPMVMILNLGSPGGPTDGTSVLSAKIDATVGAGKPGLAFLTGTGDDGGQPNHATGAVGASQTADLKIHKASAAGTALTVDFWYDERDRFDVSVVTPVTTYGPYASPPANSDYTSFSNAEFQYSHQGSGVHFADATYNAKRRIFFRMLGGPGDYTLHLSGASVTVGTFEASLNPSEYWNSASAKNAFTTFVAFGKTIWDGASAAHDIAPNSYVLRNSWTDVDGIPRTFVGEGLPGELWKGSSIGPTYDGRIGVDFSAPGDRTISTYSPTSYWATFRSNLVQDGAGLYGIASAVSAANPLSAGIVALLLEKQPTLDAAKIKSLLHSSARSDAYTGAVPNTQFGYGKINALAALDAIGALPNLNQHGLTGSWYEAATSGQGVEVEVYPNPSSGTGSTFVSWFTYDTVIGGAERQRWYTAQGQVVTGQPTASLTIYRNTGGNFNGPPVTNAQAVGTATLSFDTCSSGQMNYTFTDGTGRTGTMVLTRLTQNVTCSTTTPYPTNADFALSGNWYGGALTSGQGFTAEVNPNSGAFFAAWYTYAPLGATAGAAGQRWFTAQGTFTPGMRSIPVTIYETTGGTFDTPTPPGQKTVAVGSGTMVFQSCSAATFNFNFTGGTSTGQSGTIALSRVGPAPPGCTS
jgi:minor extracellular serine protease Vpr